MLPSYKVSIDWLSITGKLTKQEGDEIRGDYYFGAEFARGICEKALGKTEILTTVPPTRHYAASFVGTRSGIRVNIGHDLSKQGWQIVISGSVCAKITDWRAVADFISVYKARVTRCDASLDLIDGRLTPDEFRKQYEDHYEGKVPRQFSFIKSASGDTVYLGSRMSERMMRIYDKAAEQKVKADWMRVELEAKEGEAHRVFETFMYAPLALVREMAEFVKADTTALWLVLNKIAAGAASERRSKPGIVGDAEKWLSGQVLSSFEKLGLKDEAAFERVFSKFQETYLAVRLWNILNPVDRE